MTKPQDDDAAFFEAMQSQPLDEIRYIARRMIEEADEPLEYSAAWVAATSLYGAERVAEQVALLSGVPTLSQGV
ncbi:MAG: hypothetical protein OXH19_05645 [Chloroflexi bacterium]|nr:hypothetical protein [Chloroflexota bacterium]MCY3589941.1 hypothetical protein [Chloroflexota bacterium]MCY3684618.1 hypothetical protein [Chloroflexota bacterium]MDE2709986.1 hypothetical protein [Chloroflexota bacterium]